MRSALLVLVAVLSVAGCSSAVAGTPRPASSPASGVDLAVPVELRPVLAPGAGGLTLADPSGEQLALGAPLLTIERLDRAQAKPDPNTGQWVLELDLTSADAATFGDWTATHAGDRLAVVVDGEVVVAPQVQGAITGGEVQVSGTYTRDEIEDLLARITGR